MVARCVVEIGTSSYYTALREAADEPVLQEICRHIAADELRHYRLFYKNLDRYLARERLGRWARLRVALGRVAESRRTTNSPTPITPPTSGDRPMTGAATAAPMPDAPLRSTGRTMSSAASRWC